MYKIKYILKKFLKNKLFLKSLDNLLIILTLLISPILIIFTKLGPKRLPKCRDTFRRIGIYPIKDHYYEPLFKHKLLKKSLSSIRNLPGIKEDMRFWNEQYILEALITDSQRYEILALTNYLCKNHYKEFKKVYPYVQKDREPGSMYLRVNKNKDRNIS